jgi:hypothetical protein
VRTSDRETDQFAGLEYLPVVSVSYPERALILADHCTHHWIVGLAYENFGPRLVRFSQAFSMCPHKWILQSSRSKLRPRRSSQCANSCGELFPAPDGALGRPACPQFRSILRTTVCYHTDFGFSFRRKARSALTDNNIGVCRFKSGRFRTTAATRPSSPLLPLDEQAHEGQFDSFSDS